MTEARWDVGRIGKPRGLKGEVRLHLDRPDLTYLEPGRGWFETADQPPALRAFELRDAQGSVAVIAIEGVSDRSAAEALAGTVFSVDATWFSLPDGPPELLLGAELVDADSGTPIGQVERYYDNGAQVILGWGQDEDERLLPFVEPFIVEVSEAVPPVIRVRPIPGLLDPVGQR